NIIDIADLDAETTDLDLRTTSAQKLQLAVRPPTAKISAPIEPLALTKWIGHECQSGSLGIVDIAAADTDSGENDLPRGAERHRREMFVDDVDMHVVDGTTQRHPISIRRPLHDFMVGVVRSL